MTDVMPQVNTAVKLQLCKSVIDSEVNLAANSWVLAESLYPGDLVRVQNDKPFIVAHWSMCSYGVRVFDVDGGEHFCPKAFPYVMMLQADFMRSHFPTAEVFD